MGVVLLLYEVIHGEVDFNLNVGLVTLGVTAHMQGRTLSNYLSPCKIYELMHLEKGCFVSFSPERN